MKIRLNSNQRQLHVYLLLLPIIICWPSLAHSTEVTVPGTANPWLAGMPAGSMAFRLAAFDTAPGQSAVLVPNLTLSAGSRLSFSASGSVSTILNPAFFGPDGNPFGGWRNNENGISGTTNNNAALVGVFLGPDQPDLIPPPPDTMFLPSPPTAQQDYAIFSPLLQQVFFIGDGLTTMGLQQQVVVPVGATRLFLGVADIHSLNGDNTGNFSVIVVPEPGTLNLALTTMVSLLGWRRWRRNQA